MLKKLSGLLVVTLILSGALYSQGALLINGAGATFPNPIYSKWIDEYHKAHGNIQINYQSVGSGAGIKQVTEGTVDFGASDGPMNDEQTQGVPGQARLPHSPLPDRPRRRRSHLQHSRGLGHTQLHARGSRRHLPWPRHQVERSPHRHRQ